MLHGTFTGPAKPWYQQLLARWLGLPVLLKREDFGKGSFQAPDFIQPSEYPTSSTLLARLEAAAHDLERDLVDVLWLERALAPRVVDPHRSNGIACRPEQPNISPGAQCGATVATVGRHAPTT